MLELFMSDWSTGYAAGAYPLDGFGGSASLECLPSNPTWHSNSQAEQLSDTLITAAKVHLGNCYPCRGVPGCHDTTMLFFNPELKTRLKFTHKHYFMDLSDAL